MNLNSEIPREFYRLFASKYMDYYQQFLMAIYEESMRSYSLLGLTEDECRAIMNERIAEETFAWSEEQFDEEGELLTRVNMASICLRQLENWGWLKRDYDESLNSYVVSFPEYSQVFVEMFQRLYSEDDTRERESVLAIYSYLYTYSSDREKNNEILKSALQASRALLRMLSNMQEGMRGYFDELSRQKSFLGIQEVLVKELNNSDSKKYAILTTTDSFYRYKEAVKELIDQNLRENDDRRQSLAEKLSAHKAQSEPESVPVEYTLRYQRIKRALRQCEEAADIIYLIEREFDGIERRYNKLIEQKTVFANRAAARIRYILMEGAIEEDQTVKLVNLLNKSNKQEEILQKTAERLGLTECFRVVTDHSLYHRRERERSEFDPRAVVKDEEQSGGLDSFVLKPLYTRQEIEAFRKKNEQDGRFQVTRDTVQSVEDLEKLFFVWQDAVEIADDDKEIRIEAELESEEGYRFSGLTIQEKE